MTLEERIWDAFTDLSDEEMADMAERACGVDIFRNVAMDGALEKYHMSMSAFAEMLQEAIDNDDFDMSEEWAIYNDDAGTIESSDDLMDMLADHEDEIVDCIMGDLDLLEELGIEEEDDDYDDDED